MNKEPRIVFNPTSDKVEFMYDHLVYTFIPGEKKILDWDVALHGLSAKCGIVEYDGSVDVKTASVSIYGEMPWRKLVSIASKRGLFKPPMGRDDVIRVLEEDDGKRA